MTRVTVSFHTVLSQFLKTKQKKKKTSLACYSFSSAGPCSLNNPVQQSEGLFPPINTELSYTDMSCYVFRSQFAKRLDWLETLVLICRQNRSVIQFKAQIITPPIQHCLPLLLPPQLSSTEQRKNLSLSGFLSIWPLHMSSLVVSCTYM